MVSTRKVFDEMSFQNSISLSCLISGYMRNHMSNEACVVFKEMLHEGFAPLHYAIGSVLRACQGLECYGFRFGFQVHGFVLKKRNVLHEVVCNGLITMYGNCMGLVDHAARVFDEMDVKSIVSWNSIILVYSNTGDAGFAFKALSGIQVDGFRLTEYTFGSLITAASSNSLSDIGSSLLE
ncbi:putative pentatricopeptide repeat-containing protein [Tanacetum coccineum]